MSEYSEVELPFLRQLASLGWTIIDQGPGVPQDAGPSLRPHFRQRLLAVEIMKPAKNRHEELIRAIRGEGA